MEDVRCFRERQTLEIRPLTFLVGENSTGKTTALACFQVLANYLGGERVDFNAAPYSMGIFKDIVRNSRPKKETFKLGFTAAPIEWVIEVSKKTQSMEPTINSVRLKGSDGEINFKIVNFKIGGDTEEKLAYLASFDGTPAHLASFNENDNYYEINCAPNFLDMFPFFHLLPFQPDVYLSGSAEGKKALANYVETFRNPQTSRYNLWGIGPYLSTFSTSPIRSRPKRTYDPTREFNDPEGSDVPMLLLRIKETQRKQWEALKTQLIEFGKSSGLFQNIEVKNLGRSLGAPFQLKFKVRGPNANIIDVGYGVSQILPILVHVLGVPPGLQKDTYFLLQQPEVHLHPRAQAELSSLLTTLASQENRAFIIETHSDYMIDRARIEIRKGNISPEDVSLIYFEPKGNNVRVHNIRFDEMANMIDVPPHYRQFFLKESDRLMGFED